MEKLKYSDVKMIDCNDLDNLVQAVYGKPYCLQQQNGCMERQVLSVDIPEMYPEDYSNDTLPEKINGSDMGVSFEAWLKSDEQRRDGVWGNCIWWERNWYPSLDMVLNDLHQRGHIDAGHYEIDIDW